MRRDFLWGMLVHVSTNMWYEADNTACLNALSDAESGQTSRARTWEIPASDELRFDKSLWYEYSAYMQKCGVNTLVLDLGDSIVYDSHPEIAVKGAFTPQQIRDEARRLRNLGFEIIPKLNFSTTHDTWLGEYSRMVSTPTYYRVCEDIIDEVCEIFSPRYIHLGMDEEVYENQRYYNYVNIRQNDWWWSDLYRFVYRVERHSARAMMWSDYARHRPDEFVARCPRSVVQCPWYYFTQFSGDMTEEIACRVRPFEILARAGFDIVGGASNAFFNENFELLSEYCVNTIDNDRLLGMLQTTWLSVEPKWKDAILSSADNVRNARKWYESR